MVEVKAAEELTAENRTQLLNRTLKRRKRKYGGGEEQQQKRIENYLV